MKMTHARTRVARGRRRSFVCAWRDPTLVAVATDPGPDGGIDRFEPAFAPSALRRCAASLILPKASYVMRTVELPPATPRDIERMLALEADAHLPDELAPFEIGHVAVHGDAAHAHGHRFEIYAARRSLLMQAHAALTAAHVGAVRVLPSAVLWRCLLPALSPGAIVVLETDDDQVELARLDADGTLTLRTSHRAEGPMSQALRSMMPRRGAAGEAVDVAWIGAHRPDAAPGTVRFLDAATINGLREVAPRAAEEPLLQMAAVVLQQCGRDPRLRSADLLPAALSAGTDRRRLLHRAAGAMACFLVALGLLVGAMHLRIDQLDAAIHGLQQRTARVQKEGRLIGAQIEQLRAIHAARRTANDLQDVVAALHAGTPDDVAYSRVAARSDGALDFNAHAPSLSLLYRVPEQLESTEVLGDVTPRGASQDAREGGAIAESSMSAQLKRGIAKP